MYTCTRTVADAGRGGAADGSGGRLDDAAGADAHALPLARVAAGVECARALRVPAPFAALVAAGERLSAARRERLAAADGGGGLVGVGRVVGRRGERGGERLVAREHCVGGGAGRAGGGGRLEILKAIGELIQVVGDLTAVHFHLLLGVAVGVLRARVELLHCTVSACHSHSRCEL